MFCKALKTCGEGGGGGRVINLTFKGNSEGGLKLIYLSDDKFAEPLGIKEETRC